MTRLIQNDQALFPRLLVAICLLLFPSLLSARVELSTNRRNIEPGGSNELAGTIKFTITGDDFRNATAAEPIFIRMTLSNSVFLTKTLVLQTDTGSVANPIHLPLRLENTGATMVANPDAVSIVRWVAGEPYFWIRVQQSSDEWLNNGSLIGPDDNRRVSFQVGISARMSDMLNDQSAQERASNLPFQTRSSSSAEGDFEDAVSTLFCLDCSRSNLMHNGTNRSRQSVFPFAFDHTAEISPGVYGPGGLTDITLTYDEQIGRSKSRNCGLVSFGQSFGQPVAGTGGLARYFQSLALGFGCDSGHNIMWNPGAMIKITATEPGFGFPENGAQFSAFASSSFVEPTSLVTINGVDLYREIYVVWEDLPISLAAVPNLEVFFEYDGANTPTFRFSLETTLMTNTGVRDQLPYGGDEQERFCTSSEYRLPENIYILSPPQ